MIWNAIDFILRETALHLRRERLIAISTISTIAVLMLVLGSMLLFLLDIRQWTFRFGDIVEVRAFFERNYARAEAEKAADEVAGWPEVRNARFVSKEEGWRWLKQNIAGSNQLKGLDNPLSDCISVHAKQPELVSEVSSKLEGLPGVKTVIPGRAESKNKGGFLYALIQFKRIVTWAGVVVSALVALAGIFIVHNTIRLALHSRWREIYIMQLIGAGRGVIAAPFLLEGMIHGALGTLLACCLLLPAHMYLRSASARSVPFITMLPDKDLVPFGLGVLLGGIVLGLTGSAFSVRRYLRRKPEWHA
jgi:cell division transport system permease protein